MSKIYVFKTLESGVGFMQNIDNEYISARVVGNHSFEEGKVYKVGVDFYKVSFDQIENQFVEWSWFAIPIKKEYSPGIAIIDQDEYQDLKAIAKKAKDTEETISRAIESALNATFRFDQDLPKAAKFLHDFAREMEITGRFKVSFTPPTEGETTVKIEQA